MGILSVSNTGRASWSPCVQRAPHVLGGRLPLVLTLWRRRERIVTPYRLRLFLLGMLGNGLYQFFFIEGLARTRVATAVLLMASTPAAIALLGRTRGIERIALRGWLGIALQLSGVAVPHGTGAARTGDDSVAAPTDPRRRWVASRRRIKPVSRE